MARTGKFKNMLGEEQTFLILEDAEDVTPEILEVAEETFDGWFDNDGPIDWEDFLDRMADPYGYNDKGAPAFDFEEVDNPAIRKIQRHVRKYKSQG